MSRCRRAACAARRQARDRTRPRPRPAKQIGLAKLWLRKAPGPRREAVQLAQGIAARQLGVPVGQPRGPAGVVLGFESDAKKAKDVSGPALILRRGGVGPPKAPTGLQDGSKLGDDGAAEDGLQGGHVRVGIARSVAPRVGHEPMQGHQLGVGLGRHVAPQRPQLGRIGSQTLGELCPRAVAVCLREPSPLDMGATVQVAKSRRRRQPSLSGLRDRGMRRGQLVDRARQVGRLAGFPP